MKVLLVRPPAPNILSFTKVLDNEPLELEYLLTALHTRGHEALIYDSLVHLMPLETFLEEHQPEAVAITGYITQEKLMLSFCDRVKMKSPHCYTILGGVHAQLNYKRLYSPHVDYIARSEDIWVFADLIDCLDSKQTTFETLNGLVYYTNHHWHENPLVPMDINNLPIPDRSHFYAYKDHFRYLELTGVATLKTTFSCTGNCNFCYCTLLAGGRYQARRLSLVIEEIVGIEAECIQIVDDDFLADPQRAWSFVDSIEKNNIKKRFICYARADRVANNPELIKALSRIGFRYFLVGLEAINTDTLTHYDKQTTAEVNQRCIEVIKGTQSEIIALMMVSHEATHKDFDDLYAWTVKNDIHYITISMFTPIPGTPLYEAYQDQLVSHDIEDWDFLHLVLEPTNMTKAQFYRAYYKLFIKLYRRAKKQGIYNFMDFEYYKQLLGYYLKRQFI
jgi:radical SAM superfamily enzyme YgiQ (UPF0313 family)